ncbi:hypothetical protein D187_000938 [Cystobacter fuscus DSM 2262]|uniref:Uncharacterized protein n=1 Tax=Cystobacter fuscus (strain ATCC 25194 / DSM 2262 / NBRC 100088 / M29) TaxID=1242864 RepID=S9P9V4_CYSF2|nr:hypothetical protein D187_000938 [Cystobacter fuscus DSM 2262]
MGSFPSPLREPLLLPPATPYLPSTHLGVVDHFLGGGRGGL